MVSEIEILRVGGADTHIHHREHLKRNRDNTKNKGAHHEGLVGVVVY